MLTLINPTQRAEPFDHADWVFEVAQQLVASVTNVAQLVPRQHRQILEDALGVGRNRNV